MKSIANSFEWKKLEQHYETIKNVSMKKMFDSDENRFNKYHIVHNDILFDYSKNIINDDTLKILFQLAESANLKHAINDMFVGKPINNTEKRAVLHTALRDSSNTPLYIDGIDVKILIKEVLSKMQKFVNDVHSGKWKGFSGKKITDIVNIGIGGSDLGPAMVCEALKHYKQLGINIHFVSNIDGSHLSETLKALNPETTLFIIASKTFTTQETITNANTAKKWFLNNGAKNELDIAKNFVALSTNRKAVIDFGINPENMFEFWNWVGGRYSLWSAIGLSIALYIGMDNYKDLLLGANQIDEHFKNTELDKNIPVILALLGIWYNNFFNSKTYSIIPYDQYLEKLPDYLQQLDMESNGKNISKEGNQINYSTAPVLWGKAGTNAQHSFFQLIHQGTQIIPIDFLVAINPLNSLSNHHNMLVSNCFAQAEALMKGKTKEEVINELEKNNISRDEINIIVNHKVFNGNRPSNTIVYKKLTPKTLGAILAIYEHKVFVQGVIWNINSFDQWGVELGKQLAGNILKDIEAKDIINNHDVSTNGLIDFYKKNITL